MAYMQPPTVRTFWLGPDWATKKVKSLKAKGGERGKHDDQGALGDFVGHTKRGLSVVVGGLDANVSVLHLLAAPGPTDRDHVPVC